MSAASVLLVLSALGVSLHFQGHSLLPYAASLAFLGVAWTLALARHSGSTGFRLGWISLLGAAFLLWAVLSLGWSGIPYLTTLNLGMYLGAGALYMLGRLVLAGPDGVPLLTFALTALGTLVAGMMILEAAAGLAPKTFFLNPNTAAAFVNVFWAIPAMIAARAHSAALVRVGLALVALMVFALAVSGSRGAALAALAVLLVLVFGARSCGATRARITGITVVALSSMVAGHLAAASGLLGDRGGAWGRMLAEAGGSTLGESSRWAIWQGTWDLIQASPVLGHGPGTFFQVYPAYRLPSDGSAGFHAHNDYLEIWAELGLPGLLLVLAIGGVCAARAAKALLARGSAPALAPPFVVAVAALGGLAVHSLVSYNLQVMVFILLAGLGLAFIEDQEPSHQRVNVRLPKVGTRALRTLVLYGVLALALMQLASMTLAHRAIEAGRGYAADHEFSLAMEEFTRAHRLWNAAEPAWTAQSRTYLRTLAVLPGKERGLRKAAKTAGLAAAASAQRRNPYRVEVSTVTAKLHLKEPEPDRAAAERAFRQALQLDPRAIAPRLGLAGLKREHGRRAEALQVINAGLRAHGDRPPPILLRVRFALRANGA